MCLCCATQLRAQCTATVSRSGSFTFGANRTLTASIAGLDSIKILVPGYPDSIKANGNSITYQHKQCGPVVIGIRLYGGPCAPKKDLTLNDTSYSSINITATASPANQCASDTVTFSTAYTSGSNYQWTFFDGATQVGSGSGNPLKISFPNVNGSGAIRTISARLSLNDANGCVIGDTITTTVKETPDASFLELNNNKQFTNCDGGNLHILLYNNSTTTNSRYTVDWGDSSPGFDSTGFRNDGLEHTYSGIGAYNIKCTVYSASGCSTTSIYQAFNGSIPTGEIGYQTSPPSVTCGPYSINFLLNNTAGNPAGTTYSIYFSDTQQSITFQHPPPASVSHQFAKSSCGYNTPAPNSFQNSFYVELTTQNPCDVSSSKLTPIRIQDSIAADMTRSDSIICENGTATFTDISAATSHFQSISGQNSVCGPDVSRYWEVSPAAGVTVVSGSLGKSAKRILKTQWGTKAVTLRFANPGTYSVKLVRGNTDDNDCNLDSVFMTICVQKNITPVFTLSKDSICAGATVSTTNTTESGNTFCILPTYTWAVSRTATVSCPDNSATNNSFTGGTSATSKQVSVQFNNPGTYQLSMSVIDVCGIRTLPKTVVVKDKPSVTLANYGPYCASTTINPTASVSNCNSVVTPTYSWTFSKGTPRNSAVANPTNILFDSVGTNTIRVTVGNECGSSTATSTLVINVPPVAKAGNDSTVCAGTTFTIGSSPISGSTYLWIPATGLNNANAANPTLTPTNTTGSPEVQRYIQRVTSGGCTIEDTVFFTVNPVPATPSIADTAFCAGGTATLRYTGTGTVTWYSSLSGGSVVSSANPFVHTPASTISYYAQVQLSGCTQPSRDPVTITVNPIPVVDAGANFSMCLKDAQLNLSGNPSGGTWSGKGMINATGTFNPDTAGTGVTKLIYSYTDSKGCSNLDSVKITVNSLPVVDAGANVSLCSNAADSILAAGTPAGGSWTGTGIQPIGRFQASMVGPGNYVVRYNFTDANGCKSLDSLTVTVKAPPTVDAGADFSICVDSTAITLSGTPSGGSWTGNGITNPSGTFLAANATVGAWFLKYQILGANGCPNTDSLKVTVNPLPLVSVFSDTTLCDQANKPVQLSCTPTGGIWNGSPQVSSGGLFTPAGTGTFNVDYFYRSPFTGCSGSDSRQITVIAPTPAKAGPDTTGCVNGTPIQLTGTPTGTWQSTSRLTSAGLFTPNTAGVFTVVYQQGAGNCLTTDTAKITVLAPPPVDAGPDISICANSPDTLLKSVSPTSGGTWSGTGITTGGVFSPQTIGSGTFTVNYNFTNVFGCSNSDSRIITVKALPVINLFASDTTICNQSISVTFSATPPGGSWFGSAISSGGVFTPKAIGDSIIYYRVTNSLGCTDTAQKNVHIVAPVKPNAGSDFSICHKAASIQLTGTPSTPNGNWVSTTQLTSTGQFTPTTVGSFALVYRIASGNCLNSDTVLATVNPLPTVNAGNDFTTCGNTKDTLIKPIQPTSGGSWTGTGITSTGLFTAINGGGVYNLYYHFTDSKGCSNLDSMKITINTFVSTNAPDTTICDQSVSVKLNATPSGGNWIGPNIDPAGNFTPSGPGSFTVRYAAVNAVGCRDTADKVINVVPPVFPTAGPDTALCHLSSPIQLNASPAGGAWKTTTLLNSAGRFDPKTAGNYSLIYELGSGNCLTRDTVKILVNALPSVNAGPDFALCTNSPDTTLVPTSATPGGSWSGSGITSGGLFTIPATNGNHTVSYRYTDANGCTNTDGRIISIFGVTPVVISNPDTSICDLPEPVFFTASPSGGSWSGPGIDVAGQFVAPDTGVYKVDYIYTNSFGCSDTGQKTITIRKPLTPNAGSDFARCHNAAPVQLNGTPAQPGGKWQTTQQLSSTGLFTPDMPGLYRLVYDLDSGNCLTHDTVIAVVNVIPTVSAGPDTSVCLNSGNFFLQLQGSPAGGIWSGPGVTGGNVYHPSTGTGTRTLYYQFTDVNGCKSNDSMDVTVDPLPVVDVFNTDTTICNQTIPVQFFGNPSGGIWSGNGVMPDGTYTPNGNGLFTFDYSIANNFGCRDTARKNVLVQAPVIPNAGSDVALCHQDSPILLNGSPASPNGQWQVTPECTAAGVFTPSSVGAFSLIYDLASGNCLTHDTLVITVKPLPIVDAGPDLRFCANHADSILFPTSAGGGIWSGGGISPTGRFSPTTGAALYIITYTFTAPNGCKAADDRLITVDPLPPINIFSSDTNLCNVGDPFTFRGYPAGGIWYGDNIIQNGIFSPAGKGDYTVFYTVSNSFGCADTAQKDIHVGNDLFAEAGNDSTVCVGSGQIQLGGVPATGNWQAAPYISSNGIFTPAYAGTFGLVFEYLEGGCLTTDTLKMRVLQQPVADFALPQLSNCIRPLVFQPTNKSVYATDFTWVVDSMFYFGYQPPITIFTTGTHHIKLIADNQHYCLDSAEQDFTLNPPFEASFTIQDSICTDTPVFPDNTSTGGTQFAWYIDDALVSNDKEPVLRFMEDGDHRVQLIASDNGCADSLDIPFGVRIGKGPLPGFVIEPASVPLNKQEFLLNCDAFNYTHSFYEVQSMKFEDSCNVEVRTTFAEPGRYPVYQVLTSPEGCVSQTVEYLEVYSDQGLYVPNAFTPDADGRNDVFFASIFGYRSYELWIFDRWGKQVFHTTDQTATWDGTDMNNHEECRPDVYPWRIIVDDMYGERTEHRGHVVLVK